MTPQLTRRAFVAAAAALPLALRSIAQAEKTPRWVFLGTNTGPGIYRASWDATTGRLGKPQLAIKTSRPDFLALHPKLPQLYSVNSVLGPAASISSFHLDTASGELQFASRQSSLGDGPCFVSIDHTGQTAFAANYYGGSFASYPLAADGALKPPAGSLQCRGNLKCGTHGPKPEQEASHIHSAVISPNNDFVLGCDLGNDSFEIFPIYPGAAKPLGTPQRVPARAGSGPRHIAFHPNGRWVYVIYELDCTVDLYDWSVRDQKPSLRFREGSVVSTLASGEKREGSSGCEIVVSPDGRFVYTCSRGVNELLVFRIDPTTGKLTEQQRLACGGKTPRQFAFDPSHRWLLSANQDGSTVTIFANDTRTGQLSGPVQTMAADTPMFVLFV
jgi:6-phosphogluconolactonase